MSRETEVATFLRADGALLALTPGGIYADSLLTVSGITDAVQTPTVWTGGTFRTCIIIRARAAVPTGDLQSIRSKRTSMSQALEAWAYGLTPEAVQAVLDRVYALMMGKRLTAAFSATWVGGMPVTQAPELPPGTLVGREDYRYVAIRRAIAV